MKSIQIRGVITRWLSIVVGWYTKPLKTDWSRPRFNVKGWLWTWLRFTTVLFLVWWQIGFPMTLPGLTSNEAATTKPVINAMLAVICGLAWATTYWRVRLRYAERCWQKDIAPRRQGDLGAFTHAFAMLAVVCMVSAGILEGGVNSHHISTLRDELDSISVGFPVVEESGMKVAYVTDGGERTILFDRMPQVVTIEDSDASIHLPLTSNVQFVRGWVRPELVNLTNGF